MDYFELAIMIYFAVSILLTVVWIFLTGWNSDVECDEGSFALIWLWPALIVMLLVIGPFVGIHYLGKFLREKYGPPMKERFDNRREY